MIIYRNPMELKAGERIDDLQRSGYGIIQKSGAFCFGIDAVLLSGFAEVRKGERAADLCTGTGIIPLLLEAKTGGREFFGVEIQAEMAEMAQRSVRLNGLEGKVHILEGDLRELAGSRDMAGCGLWQRLGEADLRPGGADVVTANPPYMKAMHGLVNPDDGRAVSRHEILCTLEDVCRAAAALLRSGGRFYMVHRPLRLPEIIACLQAARLEPKRIRPVYPYADKEANMVLIEAVRDGRPECRLEKPVIVYEAPGVCTAEIRDIYGY